MSVPDPVSTGFDPEDPLPDLVADFVDRQLDGDPVTVDEFCARHPSLADELRPRLEVFQRLGEVRARHHDLAIGDVFGELRIDDVIGRGGMGTVYRATDLALGREVAVKVGRGDARAIDPRFVREARAIARVRHPNVVAILSFEFLAGHPAIVMQHVDGEPLSRRIQRKEVDDVSLVARHGAALARGLAAVHRARILHRDIKPSNILLGRDGVARLADFGLARLQDDASMSASGEVGTPAYMSPEQIDGESLDETSDIYSLGATLFEWLTHRRPFETERRAALYRDILNRPPPRLRQVRPDLPRSIERLVDGCLHKDPRRRYQTADQLARDLDAVADQRPLSLPEPRWIDRARAWAWNRRRLLALLVAVVATSIGAAWLLRGREQAEVAAWVARAELAFERARFDEAVAHLDEAIDLDGASGRIHFLRADARTRDMALKHTPMEPSLIASVLADFDRAHALGYERAGSQLARAFLLRFLGRAQEAEAAYLRGIALPHETASDYFHRAGIDRALGRMDDSQEAYRAAIRMQPICLLPYVQLAAGAMQRGDVDEGLLLLDQAERIHPRHAAIAGQRALLWIEDGRFDDAEALLWKHARRRPAPRRVVEALSQWLYNRGRLVELKELFDELDRDEPHESTWRIQAITVRLQLGRLDEAEGLLDAWRGAESDPVRRALGVVLRLMRGELDAAIDRVTELSREPGWPHLLRAIDAASHWLRWDQDRARFFDVLDDLRATDH